jgi:hypothetical protein
MAGAPEMLPRCILTRCTMGMSVYQHGGRTGQDALKGTCAMYMVVRCASSITGLYYMDGVQHLLMSGLYLLNEE